MSKVAKIVGIVAGVAAVVATGGAALGVLAGGTMFLTGVASAATIASIAGAISAVANTIATSTAKKPSAKGTVSAIMIGATMAVPYAMGRTYAGGMQVFDNSGGDKTKYRSQVMVVTAGGPIDSYESLMADYAVVGISGENATGWFSGYMTQQKRLGIRPETAHTDANGMPGWTSAHKLSGYASYRMTMKFDKDGKRFASGIPQFGVIGKMVKVYDPRLDTTYPGGLGAQRWNDEATWAWSESPALHALAYARGRYVEKDAAGVALTTPVRLVGIGLRNLPDAIDFASFVEFANLCDANVWKVGGVVYEAPDVSKWDNLKRIMQAGGAQPVWAGGLLRCHLSAPRPSLFTITADDIAEGAIEVRAMKSFRDRRNSIVPKYRDEASKWEYIQGTAVTAATYLAEDGELKTEEVQFDLVQGKDQAAQLAAYEMTNAREFGPITMTVKPRLLAYRIGEAGLINIPEAGLNNQLAVITGRSINPSTGMISLTMESETTSKHAYSLGRTGTAPPTPSIRTSQELDEGVAEPSLTDVTQLIANSAARGLDLTISTVGVVTVSAHDRVYADKFVSVTGATVTPSPAAVAADKVGVFYDQEDRAGGAVTYQYSVLAGGNGEIDHLFASAANPFRHFVALLAVPAAGTSSGGSGTGSGTGGTGGGVGGGYSPNEVQP